MQNKCVVLKVQHCCLMASSVETAFIIMISLCWRGDLHCQGSFGDMLWYLNMFMFNLYYLIYQIYHTLAMFKIGTLIKFAKGIT